MKVCFPFIVQVFSYSLVPFGIFFHVMVFALTIKHRNIPYPFGVLFEFGPTLIQIS
jgi:hypothetical protein